MYQMPLIPMEKLKAKLSPGEYKLVNGIIAKQGKSKGRLLKAKPKVDYDKVRKPFKFQDGTLHDRDIYMPKAAAGATAYIWRMVAFHLCACHPYSCMPITADFNLRCNVCTDQEKKLRKRLDVIVDKIVNEIPKESWGGILAWKRAIYG